MVFGTAIYHPRSSICRSALHNGSIPKNQAGQIHLLLTGKKPMFNGSEGEANISSGTFSAAEKSYTVSTANPVIKIECTTTANQAKFAGTPVNSKFVVMCPKKCSQNTSLTLYGTDYYTDNSSICAAAIHRGVINDLGGEVKFSITAGKEKYKGSNGFGVISKEMGPHIRSFIFLGTKAAIHYKYSELCNGNIKDNWVTVKSDKSVQDSNSNLWKFEKDVNAGKGLEKFTGITHEGNINLNGMEHQFATWIYLKNAEWANGTVKFNLFLKESKKPVAFMFRYKDKSNYYAIEFHPAKMLFNVSLLIVKDGNL